MALIPHFLKATIYEKVGFTFVNAMNERRDCYETT